MLTRRPRASLGAGSLVGVIVWLSTPSGAPRMAAPHLSSVRELPLAAQAAISNVLGRKDAAYAVVAAPSGCRADNPAHDVAAEFPAGMQICHGDAAWTLQLPNYGYGNAESAVSATEPHAAANRVEKARSGLAD